MNTEETITTVKKEKDPKKVAAGKRLSEISRAAKKLVKCKSSPEPLISESTDYPIYYGIGTVLCVGGVIGIGYYLAFGKKKNETPLHIPDPVVTKKNNLIQL